MEFDSSIKDSDLVEGLDINFFKYTKIWSIISHYRDRRERSSTLHIGVVITILSQLPFVMIQVLHLFFMSSDLKSLLLMMLNPLSATQSMIKVGVFYLFIEKQSALINLFRSDFLPSITPEKRKQASHIYNKLSSESNFFCFIALVVNICCVATWNLLPIVRSKMAENLLNVTLQKKGDGPNKILGGWYPFPYNESPWYEGVYVYEFIACFWCGFLISLYETLIVCLVMMLGTHLRVLGYYISEVTEDTKSNKENRIDLRAWEKTDSKGISAHKQLLVYVKDHQMLMKVADEFKNLYNFLITMQLGLGLLIMTISVFHFIFSTDLDFAMYSSAWFEMDKTFRDTCQMVMVKARTPVSLIAVRLYPVNSITLLSMMQFTYSTAALLSRLTE